MQVKTCSCWVLNNWNRRSRDKNITCGHMHISNFYDVYWHHANEIKRWLVLFAERVCINVLSLLEISGCLQYTWLNESNRRYDYYGSSNQKCDSNLAGWYRFGGNAGTQMYTSCRSSRYYCNTYYPGYLNGGHPNLGDGIVSRTVCFYYYSYRSCCGYYSTSIKVINCDGYYVYKLNGTPLCNARYCSTQ